MDTMKLWTILLLLVLVVHFVDSTRSRGKIRRQRTWIVDSFEVEEEHPGPYPLRLGRIHLDVKYLVQFHISGMGVDKEPMDLLTIDQSNGDLMMKRPIDYEHHKLLKLTFEAKNVTNGAVDTRLGIEIKVRDVNDNVPQLDMDYEVSLDESQKQGTPVVTVKADDSDDAATRNGTFDLRIVSVTPPDPDVDFVLEQSDTVGKITFKGCLNYEKTPKYTIMVEARDRGEVVQLSSTGMVTINVNDNNNHPPVFTGQTGSGIVKEGVSGMTLLRVQVSDADTKGTAAWRARYMVYGDKGGHFEITTDPETNEGILNIIKPLDYEDGHLKNMTISVENEEPYFTCKVKGHEQQGLWDVEWVGDNGDSAAPRISRPITITVEDVNDPPFFLPSTKDIRISENAPIGTPLHKFTAEDHDGIYANSFEYRVGSDPAGWVAIDSTTGQVSTKHILDRESLFVNNSIYTVILWAADHGEPPMTGTGTLNILLIDQNDNFPVLEMTQLALCLSDETTSTKISAHDLDLKPFSDPFHFELVGDHKGKWKLDPTYGTTVNLVKYNSVYAGHHQLTLRISDSQGHHSLQNLTVTVCDCTQTTDCLMRSTSVTIGVSATGVLFLALLLVILVLACLFSCKREKVFIQQDEGSGWHLLHSNIETPGTDCKMPLPLDEVDMVNKPVDVQTMQTANPILMRQSFAGQSNTPTYSQVRTDASINQAYGMSSSRRSFRLAGATQLGSQGLMARGSFRETSHQCRSSFRDASFLRRDEFINSELMQRLEWLQGYEEELGHYTPHEYAEEGEPTTDPMLDALSISSSNFNTDILQHLDPKFRTLATICRPDLME